MTKLKLEMEVVYVEANLIDKTKVIRVDKENGTAVLANGIVLNREILKKGYFKRAGKKGYFKRAGRRSEAKAYLYEPGSEGYKIYEAYINRVQLINLIPAIKHEIEKKDIMVDQGWLKEFRSIIEKFIGQ